MLSINYKDFIVWIQIFGVLLIAHAAWAQERPAPEISTQVVEKQGVTAKLYMAVTANPLATRAAERILAQGGSAADAAIAAQLVLGLVEPQSSGLGGGAFALYYNAKSGTVQSWDARETAPELATPDLFLKPDGAPMEFLDAVIGGRSVGTPGTPALLHKLYKEYGRLPAAQDFESAIALAKNGFAISPRLAGLIDNDKGRLDRYPEARAYFYHEDGSPKQVGEILKNPAYAKTLERFRDRGLRYYYHQAAPDIIATIQSAGGYLSEADLENYKVKERPAVCGFYHAYKVCSMGQPSSGGLTLLAILGMLERFDLSDGPTIRNLHLIAEASRLAFADRNQYMADPDFVKTPDVALIAPDYLKQRSALIAPDKTQTEVSAGMPDHEKGTSHMVMVDRDGNVLSMTTTIESAFGSKLMVDDFLLNNELTDFNFKTGTANSVEPGKRPRSSMSPTIVFAPDGKPFMALGSAGGSQIIGYVLEPIIAVIDWHKSVQEALDMKHALARSDTVELETGLENMKAPLEKLGHKVKVGDMNSGLTAILFQSGAMMGAADPRREGITLGN